MFCDLDGRCLNAIPRTMIESKGGESIKGMTIRDETLIELARHVAETLGIVGPANIQCFREPDGTHCVTDINPRFGGGFPLPLAAGGRYPELALALARGEQLEPRLGDFREGVVMTRFFSDLSLTPNGDGTLKPLAPANEVRRHRGSRVHRLAADRGAASQRATTCVGGRLLHRLLRRRAEGGERGAGSTSTRLDLAEEELDFDGLRRRLPPGRAAGRAQLRRRVPGLPAPQRAREPQRVFEAAAATACASCSRRRLRSTAPPSATRRPRTPSRIRSRRTGSRSSPASSSPTPTPAAFGLDASCCATSRFRARGSGPTWRFARIVDALARARRSSCTATATSRAA